MRGKGPKRERETIINFNEEEGTASVWTASETIYRRLKRLGYEPVEDEERHALFEMPKRDIKLPRPKRVLSEKQRKALAKARRGDFASSAPVGAEV